MRSVHPRVCGELTPANPLQLNTVGSSPRVRGTDIAVASAYAQRRFIPACAGNWSQWPADDPTRPVHPRVCGELDSPCSIKTDRCGSSPRVRGTGTLRTDDFVVERFIPACAGNWRTILAVNPSVQVHPRVCGELTMSGSYYDGIGGSSPRVRGTGSW